MLDETYNAWLFLNCLLCVTLVAVLAIEPVYTRLSRETVPRQLSSMLFASVAAGASASALASHNEHFWWRLIAVTVAATLGLAAWWLRRADYKGDNDEQ